MANWPLSKGLDCQQRVYQQLPSLLGGVRGIKDSHLPRLCTPCTGKANRSSPEQRSVTQWHA